MSDRSYATIHLIGGDPVNTKVIEILLDYYGLADDGDYWYGEEMSLGLWSNTVTYNRDDVDFGKSVADLIIEIDPTVAFCATQDGYGTEDIGETVFYIPSLGKKHCEGAGLPMFSWQQVEGWLDKGLTRDEMRAEAGEVHQDAWNALVRQDEKAQAEELKVATKYANDKPATFLRSNGYDSASRDMNEAHAVAHGWTWERSITGVFTTFDKRGRESITVQWTKAGAIHNAAEMTGNWRIDSTDPGKNATLQERFCS